MLGYPLQYARLTRSTTMKEELRAAGSSLLGDEAPGARGKLPLKRWLRTMFLEDFPLSSALLIWDCFLLHPGPTLLLLGRGLARLLHTHRESIQQLEWKTAYRLLLRVHCARLLRELTEQLSAAEEGPPRGGFSKAWAI